MYPREFPITLHRRRHSPPIITHHPSPYIVRQIHADVLYTSYRRTNVLLTTRYYIAEFARERDANIYDFTFLRKLRELLLRNTAAAAVYYDYNGTAEAPDVHYSEEPF